ncbi:carbohydrate sulfotransferase 3-like [Palaemon carinicauda]|uniref:carbohydrate sulfotransferase 3-like n=1 Tax=Palaemon carinicauda TaxID=392227 RepID=UPI0035B57709
MTYLWFKARRAWLRQRLLILGFLLSLLLLTQRLQRNNSIYMSLNKVIADDARRVSSVCSHLFLNKTHNPEPSRGNILLLGSMGRSGSSFLGGLLSSLPGVFYYFEPFYNFQQWGMHSQALAVQSLKELYHCNYSGPVYKAIRARGSKSLRHWSFNSCHSKQACFNIPRLSKICSREPIRLVKTIRTRVSWLLPLLQDQDLNLHVIHIARDPRASIISNWKAGWNVSPKNLCEGLLEDLQYGPHLREIMPSRYIAVRYEDVCADPRTVARNILHFLGYSEIPQSTIKFLDKTTSRNSSPKDAYSLQRNSTEQQQKWRKYIRDSELHDVENACSDAIRHLGFNLFGNMNTTRNMTFPLFNDSFTNTLFSYEDCVNVDGSTRDNLLT